MTRAIGFDVETAYGTASTSYKFIKALNIEKNVDRGAMLEETIDAKLYNAAYGGALKVSGSVESNFRPGQHANLLEALMGNAVAGTGLVTYSLDDPLSLTACLIDDSSCTDYAQQIKGVGIKSAAFTFAPKEYVKVKYDWFGQNIMELASVPTVSYVDEKPVVFDGAVISLAGTPVTTIKALDISIDRKLDEDNYVIGSSVVQGGCTSGPSVNGVADIGGTLTFTQGAWTEYLRAQYGVGTGLSGKKIAESVGEAGTTPNDLGSASLSIKMKYPDGTKAAAITATALVYTDSSISMQGRQGVDKKVSFKIVGDKTDDFNIITGASAFTSFNDFYTEAGGESEY